MTQPNPRFAGPRFVAITLVIATLCLVAPATCDASCGDYLRYGHPPKEEKPVLPPLPCGCLGAECSSPSDIPPSAPTVPSTAFDELAALTASSETDRTRGRFGRPTSSEDASINPPRSLDPPPRKFALTDYRSELSLQLRGGFDGPFDSTRAGVQAGDGSR